MGKNLVKRLAVYAATGLAINLLILWFHVRHPSALGVVFTVLTFTICAALWSHLIEKRLLPGIFLRALDRIPPVSAKALGAGLVRFVAEYPALVFGLIAVIPLWTGNAPRIETLPPTAQAVYNATLILGLSWIVASSISLAFFAPANVVRSAISIVERLILVSLVLVAERAFGPELTEVLRIAKDNPDASLAVVAAFVLLRAVSALSPSRNCAVIRGGMEAAGYAVARPRQRKPEDIQRTAIHEAGHVLIFATRGELPEAFTVSVRAEITGHDLYRGYVDHAEPAPDVLTEGYLRWSMQMLLAGAEAEYVALGERADGAQTDNAKWLTAATAYLSSGFGEVFYAEPAGDAQIEHNRVVLNALKSECTQAVRTFLNANRLVLDELSTVIAKDKTLTRDQLAPYVARVELP